MAVEAATAIEDLVDISPLGTDDTAQVEYKDKLEQIQGGLVSMLDEDNELMKLARRSGERVASSKGLGQSSYAARASQGAAMDYAVPLVTEATRLQTTVDEAQKERVLRETLQTSAQEYTTGLQTSEQAHIVGLQKAQEDAATALQANDIDYKKWLEGSMYEHQASIASSQQASSAYKTYLEGIATVYNNKETTTAQKMAAANAMRTGIQESMALVTATSNLDLTQFLAGGSEVGSALTSWPEGYTSWADYFDKNPITLGS